MQIKKVFQLSVISLSFYSGVAGAMSVEEAYQAIPHARTVFDGRAAKMDKTEVEGLQRLFDWIDQAIVAKVIGMTGTPADQAYTRVWAMKTNLKTPAKLKDVQATVEASIQSEYQYIKTRQATGVKSFNAADPQVQAASQKAHQAYSQLMAAYPNENASNKQAFFDYLCALDFL